jgi:hypothetical protein
LEIVEKRMKGLESRVKIKGGGELDLHSFHPLMNPTGDNDQDRSGQGRKKVRVVKKLTLPSSAHNVL